MAGGLGERFWPASRRDRPKQFLAIASEHLSMIEETWRRALSATRPEHVFISLREDLLPLCRSVLPDCPLENYIIEPLGRDTAAAMGLASVFVESRRPGSVMAVLPSDHLIRPEEAFAADLHAACRAARDLDCIVTLGVKPVRPETGYGYIETGEPIVAKDAQAILEVKRFAEKPDRKTAELYVKSGRFLWNAGIFVWKPSVFLSEMEKFLPDHYHGLREIQGFLDEPGFLERAMPIFEKFRKISVDFGIMEKARNILCRPASFEWDDVGSWSALERIRPSDANGNTTSGRALCFESRNCVAVDRTEDGLTVIAGLENVIVIRTGDAILVYDKRREDLLKNLLKLMKDDPELSKYL